MGRGAQGTRGEHWGPEGSTPDHRRVVTVKDFNLPKGEGTHTKFIVGWLNDHNSVQLPLQWLFVFCLPHLYLFYTEIKKKNNQAIISTY